MESTVSVAKGVFVFKNGFKTGSKHSKRKKKAVVESSSIYADTLWYSTYATLWNSINKKIQMINHDMFSNVLRHLIDFIKNSYLNPVTEIPTAALLTGINMPDHAVQFSALKKTLEAEVTPHVAYLPSHDCSTAVHLIEKMVYQLLDEGKTDDEEESDTDTNQVKIKKAHCTFPLLEEWYRRCNESYSPKKNHTNKVSKKVIVLIIPDFEGFQTSVLHTLIDSISHYMNKLPFVLVFGVATSLSILHKTLHYRTISKINISVFNSQSSTAYLNNVLEYVFFTESCPFHLKGEVFSLLTDIFLFYDLSVTGFISNFKYALLEHFSYGNAMSLCCTTLDEIEGKLKKFTHEDCENVRRLLSFRKFVENESYENRIELITNDTYFKQRLKHELQNNLNYLNNLHVFLKCLHILVFDLPKAPLGKQVRELYALAATENIVKTKEYTECFQLLSFLSKDELSIKISKISDVLTDKIMKSNTKCEQLEKVLETLNLYVNNLNSQNVNDYEMTSSSIETTINDKMDRKQLKEKLMAMAQNKPINRYEEMKRNLLQFLNETFENFLIEPRNLYFYEIFFFTDMSIQSRIIGSNRAAIHNALNDPQYYLQCDCCEFQNEGAILPSMPDICIAYKLHLECGRLINLYDWLQAFLSILDPIEIDDETKRIVKPELQARFTQAVAELEFLGFVKSCRSKVDHVSRLTWGG